MIMKILKPVAKLLMGALLLAIPSGTFAQKPNVRGVYRYNGPTAPLSVRPFVKKVPSTAPSARRVQLSNADGREIYGIVVAQLDDSLDNFSQTQQWGWYKFNATNPISIKNVFYNTDFSNFAGGAVYDGHLHITNYYAPYSGYGYINLYDFDLSNPGEEPAWQSIYGNMTLMANDLAYRKSDGKVYGYFWDGSQDTDSPTYTFGTLDYSSGELTTINANNDNLYYIALSFDNDDKLWGLDASGNLWNIDPTTGNVIGGAHVLPFEKQRAQFFQSMTCDARTGLLYYAGIDVDHNTELFQINTKTFTIQKVADIPNKYEVVCLYIPDVLTADDAPAGISDLKINFEAGALSGTADFTLPAKSFDGENLSGNVEYRVIADGDTIASGSGAAGSKVSAPISFDASGFKTFSVVPVQNGKYGPESEKTKMWVGPDVPMAPESVTLTNDGKNIRLSWTPVTKGVNGGYVDSAAVAYDIMLLPDSIEEVGITDTVYTTTLPDSPLKDYHYAVRAVYKDQESAATNSNHIQAGDAYTVPYTESFDSDDDFNLFTVLDFGGSGSWASSWYNVRIFHFSGHSDDWLITPPIKLNTGTQYQVECTTSPGYTSNPDSLQILLGTNVNDTSSFREIVPGVKVDKSSQKIGGTFSVSANGEYRVAFRSLGDDNSYGIILDDIKVTEKTALSAPDSVTNLKATAAGNGQLKATIEFKAPSKDIEGGTLSALDSIVVYRGETEVQKLTDVKPGSAYSVVDNNPSNGLNTYTVKAYNTSEGTSASVTVYVGVDVPKAPVNVRAVDNNNGTATLTWDAPSNEGANGQYVAPQALTYTVYDPSGNAVAENLTDKTFGFSLPQTGQQAVTYYMVSAKNVAGEGNAARSNAVYSGAPDQLPISDSFAGGNYHYMHWGSEDSQAYNYFGTFGGAVADNDWGSICWTAYDEGEEGWFRTGKVSLAGNAHPAVFFQYMRLPGKDIELDVYADCATKKNIQIFRQDFKELTDSGWQKVAAYLPQEAIDAPYVIINFHVKAMETKQTVSLDDITIRDVADNDLATSITAPSGAVKNKPINVSVKVSNRGRNLANAFTVSLVADGKTVATQQGGSLVPNTDSTYTFTFTPNKDTKAKTLIYAQAQFDNLTDGEPADNQSSVDTLNVEEPQFPAVDSLSANANADGSIRLTWKAPENLNNVVSEDFENVTPWTTDNFNGFTTFVGDKRPTNQWTLITFPHMGEVFAWILMNGNDITLDESQVGWGMGHNSLQAVHSVSNVHDYQSMDANCDYWLISPELSGKAQTIKFWARSEGNRGENYSVYASTENADTASLLKNRVFDEMFASLDWTEYSYDLPEGTKYFGIRYWSNLTGLAIDDVTYEGVPLQLTGYKVYCDSDVVAELPATQTSWTDAQNNYGDHVYSVTAVYSIGESSAREVALPTAIFQIGRTLNTVRAIDGAIEINAAQPVNASIYSVGGASVFNGTVNGVRTVSVPRGQYIVRLGKKSVNLVVK